MVSAQRGHTLLVALTSRTTKLGGKCPPRMYLAWQPSLEEPHRILIIADQQIFGVPVVIKHHFVVLATDA